MNIFTKHPHSVGETYLQHMKFACKFGSQLIGGGIACVIHAIFPFFFQNTGSQITIKLAKKFENRNQTK
jgi:hypothetical protein